MLRTAFRLRLADLGGLLPTGRLRGNTRSGCLVYTTGLFHGHPHFFVILRPDHPSDHGSSTVLRRFANTPATLDHGRKHPHRPERIRIFLVGVWAL
mgnify:CR=1 FL=1